MARHISKLRIQIQEKLSNLATACSHNPIPTEYTAQVARTSCVWAIYLWVTPGGSSAVTVVISYKTATSLYKIWGVHGGDYEECRLLGYKNPVRTSQETHYVSPIESSRLLLWKIWGFRGGTMKMSSSRMLRRVALVRTEVSEDFSASIIRVTRIGELGTTFLSPWWQRR
jgi:hypothetical protein